MSNEFETIRIVDGIPFRLPEASLSGAEQARVRLSDLAHSLGYADRSKLKQLADRHAQELAEFGSSATVAVLVSREGRGSVVVYEPTYNPDQAAYLALSSETPQGRACRVRILKAYKALLAEFEQAQKPSKPLTQIQMLAAQAQAMADLEERQAEASRLLAETTQRVVSLEEHKRRAEAEVEAAFALPPASVSVTSATDGQRTTSLLRAWAIGNGGAFQEAHRLLYGDVLARPETRIDLRARLENAQKNRKRGEKAKRLCDIIDDSGKAAEIYAIAIQRFRPRAA